MGQAQKIRLYGGPLHGEFHYWNGEGTTIVCHDRDMVRDRIDFRFPPKQPVLPPEPMWDRRSYRVDVYRERRGMGERDMCIGLLEGRDIQEHERWQVERDLESRPWYPVKPPSILHNFESWFAWCAYKHTGEQKHIHEELYNAWY